MTPDQEKRALESLRKRNAFFRQSPTIQDRAYLDGYAAAIENEPPECVWTFHNDEDATPGCRDDVVYPSDGDFCPYCGGRIKEGE